jgi:hypothetical protein
VTSADEIRAYLQKASEARLDGFALFSWYAALPFMDELSRNGDLRQFPLSIASEPKKR